MVFYFIFELFIAWMGRVSAWTDSMQTWDWRCRARLQLSSSWTSRAILVWEVCPPKGYVQILTLRTCDCDLVWKSLCWCNTVKLRCIKLREGRPGFLGGSEGKESACNARDPGSIPGSGRSLKEGMATYSSILAWRTPWTEEPGGAIVHGVSKSRTWLSG